MCFKYVYTKKFVSGSGSLFLTSPVLSGSTRNSCIEYIYLQKEEDNRMPNRRVEHLTSEKLPFVLCKVALCSL